MGFNLWYFISAKANLARNISGHFVCVLGRSKSPSPNRAGGGGGNRIDSPTPATDPDHGKPTTVAGIMSASQRIKVRT